MWEWLSERITGEWRHRAHQTHTRVTGRYRSLRPNRPLHPVDAAEAGVLAYWNCASRAYFQRWMLIGALIGVVAGLGAILFYTAIAFCTHLFLEVGAGFIPPSPAGEGVTRIQPVARPWLLPVITTLGGLLCGLIVYTFAPEAEGHGTDAAIEAFHKHGGQIRARIPRSSCSPPPSRSARAAAPAARAPRRRSRPDSVPGGAICCIWTTTTGALPWRLESAPASALSSRRHLGRAALGRDPL